MHDANGGCAATACRLALRWLWQLQGENGVRVSLLWQSKWKKYTNSKSLVMHDACLKLFLHRYDHERAIILMWTTTTFCSCWQSLPVWAPLSLSTIGTLAAESRWVACDYPLWTIEQATQKKGPLLADPTAIEYGGGSFLNADASNWNL